MNFRRLMHDDRGATMAEYAAIGAAVLALATGGFALLGKETREQALCTAEVLVGARANCAKGSGTTTASAPASGAKGWEVAAKSGEPICDPLRGCSGGKCFAAGTLVHTLGGLRAIETIREGELVLATDEETSERKLLPVEHVVVSRDRELLELTVKLDGDTLAEPETLRPTPDHAFWVQGKGWVKASALAIGELIDTRVGARARVVAKRAVAEHATVFNLEVEQAHTYHVGRWGLLGRYACERVPPTASLRAAARQGPLWQKSRFDAIQRLAACRDLTADDYASLAEAIVDEDVAKRDYLASLPSDASTRRDVRDALSRRWFDRAEQALLAGLDSGEGAALQAVQNLRVAGLSLPLALERPAEPEAYRARDQP